MKELNELSQIDYKLLFYSFLIFIFVILPALILAWKSLNWLLIERLGLQTKWGRKRKEEHDLLISTAQALQDVSEKSDQNDDEIKQCLSDFMNKSSVCYDELRNDLNNSVREMKKIVDKVYSDNLSYRNKSETIRNNMNEKIRNIVESNDDRDNLIKAIANGNKELLGDKIDQKFDKYIKLCGIPANEVDEFESMCQAYFSLNGNHNRKKKYDYVTKRMQVIPVETNLLLEMNDESQL